jgi:DNA modification methylase
VSSSERSLRPDQGPGAAGDVPTASDPQAAGGGGVTDLRLGDCLDVMRTLPDASANCCVTSPPYFGLRDYGHSDQIGLEPTPDEFVAKLVAVFREVRRVLRDDGTLWLNLGDSYFSTTKGTGGSNPETSPKQAWKGLENGQGFAPVKLNAGTLPIKPKDLIGIPWRVAFALQADGWYLRQDIIWHKPNPMPESVTDRCTKAHEYIFLLSKSARYYYDGDAIKEQSLTGDTRTPYGSDGAWAMDGRNKWQEGKGGQRADADPNTRNRRSVWTVATQPYSGAHFATFPPKLIEPCILAGCSIGGTVLDPFTGSGTTGEVALLNGRQFVGIELNPDYYELARQRITRAAAAGYQPSLLEGVA